MIYTAAELAWYSGMLPRAPIDDRCAPGRDDANCPLLDEIRRVQRMGFENYTIRREIRDGVCRLTQVVDGHDCLGFNCPGEQDA